MSIIISGLCKLCTYIPFKLPITGSVPKFHSSFSTKYWTWTTDYITLCIGIHFFPMNTLGVKAATQILQMHTTRRYKTPLLTTHSFTVRLVHKNQYWWQLTSNYCIWQLRRLRSSTLLRSLYVSMSRIRCCDHPNANDLCFTRYSVFGLGNIVHKIPQIFVNLTYTAILPCFWLYLDILMSAHNSLDFFVFKYTIPWKWTRKNLAPCRKTPVCSIRWASHVPNFIVFDKKRLKMNCSIIYSTPLYYS